ncbi:MAG: hypothetical protein KC656_03015 [Myxococcales bacterium]|nr:hypothetical protein [Myxococcales bacterium]MCB9671863.1 hypothetical protein [Alphaproteobacteria bacterium]
MDRQAFIAGELVDLLVPSEQDIEDGWADWFNDQPTCRFLGHGAFPMFPADQRAFLESLRKRDRIALMLRPKGEEKTIGTVSLSSLDLHNRTAQIALVLGARTPGRHSLLPLEGMARLMEHGFEVLGLRRIWAGQAFPGLSKWSRKLEVLGLLCEGHARGGFARGRVVTDSIPLGCLVEDYDALRASRDGRFWSSAVEMQAEIDALPKTPFAEEVAAAMEELRRARFPHLAQNPGPSAGR